MREEIRTLLKFLSPGKNVLGFLGVLLVLAVAMCAVLAPYVAPHNPYKVNLAERLRPPSWAHPFGTDELGRDVLSRVLLGTRISLQASVVIIALSLILGTGIGTVGALAGGWVDDVLMRLTDSFLAFPYLVFAMLVSAVLGPNLTNAMLAISITWWPWYARLARGQILSIKNQLYVEAARAIGVEGMRLFFRYFFRNAFSPLIVQATLDVGYAVLLASSLSFVGLGAQPPTPEWGRMVADGRQYLLSYWWVPIFPGLAIFVTVLGFNLIGDAIRDFADPRTRR
ncbi:MAG: nickel transporter permease [Candidatus Hadarchaeum sp.]|uniref:nickel transporter permease n=1 Tax=Candidatus Hadarchaeum sp. TaxID=2883567 RepID=UPI003D0A373A